jgi:hypothetical protein
MILLNDLLNSVQAELQRDMSFDKAIHQIAPVNLKHWFTGKMDIWLSQCLLFPDKLKEDCQAANKSAYDRSMWLQDQFYQERPNQKPLDNLILTLGYLKTIYISMAPHYSVEAHMDDAHIKSPWHLPNLATTNLQSLLTQIQKCREIDWGRYLLGMRYYFHLAPCPDLFKFDPILSSLIAPYVTNNRQINTYHTWKEFNSQVIVKLPLEICQAFNVFAQSMNITLEQAVFAGWRMLAKDVRKRQKGWDFLYTTTEALQKFQELNKRHTQAYGYYGTKYQLANAIIGKTNHHKLRRLIHLISIVEHTNALIGCYKFIPWRVDDENFQGKYLPYALMRWVKTNLYDLLLGSCQRVWLPKGNWFRNILASLLSDNPSMYAKWCLPLLEQGYIDKGAIAAANQVCLQLLENIHQEESGE